jgi:lipopolysaccharide export system protein LptA
VKKYVLSFLFLLIVIAVFGQNKPKITAAPVQKKPNGVVSKGAKTSIIHLVSSETVEYTKDATGKTIGKAHKGVFQQDNSIMQSDSTYFYPDQNTMDAFGHVHITQGDTLNIYSDKLNYNGNIKLAILTDHVKMIDKDATLTTDYLTYNTGTRIGVYNNGGKLVNKDNTLVSKNGYYFAKSRDAYFRYDVVSTTNDAIIKSDTLRYNTGTRISYFYGPTHIYGRKDKDTLYTEDGTYDGKTEQARFGKKNLYSQGTKTLKGDSLFYDRLKGYGRAVKHVVFNDNEQKATIYGDLGEYYKADDRAVITQNPYVVFVVEDKDTTRADSVAKKLIIPTKADSVNKKLIVSKTDPVVKKLGLKTNEPNQKLTVNKTDPIVKKLGLKPDSLNQKLTIIKTDPLVKKLGLKTDSVIKKPILKTIPGSDSKKQPALSTPDKPKNQATKGGNATTKDKVENKVMDKADTRIKSKTDTTRHVKLDSMYMAADTLETKIVTYKELKETRKARLAANNRDTSIKVVKHLVLTKAPKYITIESPQIPLDTSFYHKEIFGKPKPKNTTVKKKPVKPVDLKKLAADSIKKHRIADSLTIIADHGLTDTSRIRIISGHHHAKIFKSDLQAVSDSMFYSYSDSTIRMYVKPMIWTQGSQLSGDTIYLQMKNRKLDNMDMFPAAFVVNIEKGDSVHFNQMGGLAMHITFKDSKLSSVAVNGNAETIAFTRDSVTHNVKDFTRSLSTGLVIKFLNGQPSRTSFVGRPDNRAMPFEKSKEEERLLKGFIWKPKDRPLSKESIINSYKPPIDKKTGKAKGGPVKGTIPVKQAKTTSNKKQGVSTAAKQPTTNAPLLNPVKDTTLLIKHYTVKKKADTLKKKQ